MSTKETTIDCPYCGEHPITYRGYPVTARREMAAHKARCPKKRYLGGELTIVEASEFFVGLDDEAAFPWLQS